MLSKRIGEEIIKLLASRLGMALRPVSVK
jgi:hypothetical protein